MGDLLSTLRTQQGWTRLDASRESGISPRIIAKLEKGGLDTSLVYLEKYLNVFALTLSAKRIAPPPPPRAAEKPSGPELDERGLPKW